MNRYLIAGAVLMATATGALADRMDERLARENHRIEEGRRSGQLSYREAAQLRVEQWRIARMIRSARSDGHVSPREARDIEAAQDAASRHIYAEKHDRETARHRRWW
jgi:uncharacterized membrane protein YebE (DUF533 family)